MIPKMTDNVNVIAGLNSRPNLRDGLTDEELKAKFDEAATLIKEYINNVLIPDIRARNIPFTSYSGNVGGTTVQEAIEWLKDEFTAEALENIPVNSVSFEKLTAAVRNILNSGIPYVGDTAPVNIEGELPIHDGQIWVKTDGGKFVSVNIRSEGKWISFGEAVLPVSKGGTGLDEVSTGAMLYGNGGKMEALETPNDSASFLGTENGKPGWKDKAAIKEALGFLNVANGEYTGEATAREIDLVSESGETITPKMLFVYRKDGAIDTAANVAAPKIEDGVCLVQGAQVMRVMYSPTNCYLTVTLTGNKLTFANKTKPNDIAPFMNRKDDVYCWTALY